MTSKVGRSACLNRIPFPLDLSHGMTLTTAVASASWAGTSASEFQPISRFWKQGWVYVPSLGETSKSRNHISINIDYWTKNGILICADFSLDTCFLRNILYSAHWIRISYSGIFLEELSISAFSLPPWNCCAAKTITSFKIWIPGTNP